MRTNIAGTFQRANLAVALKTAKILCQQLDADKIYNALTQIKIPGRMEEIAPGIIVDVSHNIQGMQGFPNRSKKYFISSREDFVANPAILYKYFTDSS